jgi:hypothetical protein
MTEPAPPNNQTLGSRQQLCEPRMEKPIGVSLCSDHGARRRVRKDLSAHCNEVVKMCSSVIP